MKRILLINSIIALTICSAVTVFINYQAEKSVSTIIENQKKNVRIQIDDKIKSLDASFSLITDGIKKRAENAVFTVEARLGNKEPEMSELEQWAAELGVNDIFLINRNGVIYNTSNRREQGFNLKKSSTSVREFIDNYLGKGIIKHDGLSVGMISGKTTTFSYYSPAGSDFIIETAINVEDYITSTYDAKLYDYLFRDYFKEALESYRFVESIDLFTRVRTSAMSILHTGRTLPLNDIHIEQLLRNKTLILENNGKYSEYRTVPYSAQEHAIKAYLFEIVYDFSTSGTEIKRVAFLSVTTVYITGLIFIIFTAVTCRTFSRRTVPLPDNPPARTGGGDNRTSLYEKTAEPKAFTGRILMVDDSRYNKFVTESYLAETGMEIVYTDNGSEALKLFAANKYDLVLTDIQMPDMNGYKLAEEIRSLEESTGRKHTPIIAITAFNLERDAQKCIEAGCDAHVAKPLNKNTLLKTVYAYSNLAGGLNMETEELRTTDGAINIEAKPEFKEVTPLFLSDLKTLKSKVTDLLDKNDYDSIQLIGHRLKGEAKSFGFDPVSDYGLFLQGAAVIGSREKTEEIISLIDDYASKVRLIYS